MSRFAAKGGNIAVSIPKEERAFLGQVLSLLADVGVVSGDPAAERLRVPVYLDDADSNQEWWRLMGEELGQARATDREVYRTVMESSGPVTLTEGEADSFLRVLNEGRLAFAARLGVEAEGDAESLPESERQALDFLGWVLEELTVELSRLL